MQSAGLALLSSRQWNYHEDLGSSLYAGLLIPVFLLLESIWTQVNLLKAQILSGSKTKSDRIEDVSWPGSQVLAYSSSNQYFLMCNNIWHAHYVLGNILRALKKYSSFSSQNNPMRKLIRMSPDLQMRKLRHRQVKRLSWAHVANKQEHWCLNPGRLAPEPTHLPPPSPPTAITNLSTHMSGVMRRNSMTHDGQTERGTNVPEEGLRYKYRPQRKRERTPSN